MRLERGRGAAALHLGNIRLQHGGQVDVCLKANLVSLMTIIAIFDRENTIVLKKTDIMRAHIP